MIRQTLLIAAAVLMAACASSKPQDIGGSSGSAYRSDDGFKMVDARSEARSSDDQFKKETKDLSGFSGYAWGASYEYIQDTMQDDGYKLLTAGSRDLWYNGEIWGEQLNVVYYFDTEGQLISGAWLFTSADEESFWKINRQLKNTYSTDINVSYEAGEFIRSELLPAGTDAMIKHELDLEDADSRFAHTVRYYFDPGSQ